MATNATTSTPLLSLKNVHAGYGAARVLLGIGLDFYAGQTVVVIGRNGVGKTTLIETIMGLTELHSGDLVWQGQPIQGWLPHRRNQAGVAWVPQEREIFASLTVRENLTVVARGQGWQEDDVYSLFPRLRERRDNMGNQLSGGEQQMLAMGRALMTNPRLLLLDEPVEGLAPIVVEEMMSAILRMRQSNMAIVLVEQKYELALRHSDRCVVIDHGTVVHEGPSAELLAEPELIDGFLGLAK